MITNNIYIRLIILAIASAQLASCKKFFDVEVNKSLVVNETVFSSDQNAVAAMNGVYYQMVQSPVVGGGDPGTSLMTGLTSDELNNILDTERYLVFEENRLLPEDPSLLIAWTGSYKVIFQANDVMEQLEDAPGVSQGVRQRLTGEACFVRALCYFHLVNLFGPVPLVVTSDYRVNSTMSRTDTSLVYDQIIADLLKAQELLMDDYQKAKRTAPNRLAATALLSRVYLYRQQWAEAETAATASLTNDLYDLESDLNQVFKIASKEVIFQLASEQEYNTNEASAYIQAGSIGTGAMELTNRLLSAFEPGDKRRSSWVAHYADAESGIELDYPAKYKAFSFDGNGTTEYFVILRLAEQFLIRAEARAHQNKIDEAVADIDSVRLRAGLGKLNTIYPAPTQQQVLNAIMQERRVEFFTEGGHRWFDLKRTGMASAVLAPIKSHWSADDVLYPVPASEFINNPKLGDQNKGY